IYRAKGFEGELLEQVVDVITSDKDRWVDTMLVEEHGLELEGPDAIKAGWWTFLAFVVAGFVPILPFVLEAIGWEAIPAWEVSIALTGVTFFFIGAIKGRVVGRSWLADGVETLALGGGAAVSAFVAGWVLRGLADGLG